MPETEPKLSSDCRWSMVDGRWNESRPGQSTIENIENRQSKIRLALESVTDPEIPVLSVLDMGMVADVRLEGDSLVVEVTPTFVGCPAIDVIRRDILLALAEIGEREAVVNVVFDPPWTSDRITEVGREKLRRFGLAPPTPRACAGDAGLVAVACPFCGSRQTDLESIFGPTLCRSIHYCRSCLQSFEHFKEV